MGKRIGLAEVLRVAELAYRHECWLDDGEATPEQFAEGVVEQFEALMAHEAEQLGCGFRRDGYGATVAAWASKVPLMWRPGWPWPGRKAG